MKPMLSILLVVCCSQLNAQTYVNASATGANNGTSWINAYTNLQTAVTNTTAGNEVWVATGTYQAPLNTHILMKDEVKVYGGFISGMTLLSQRNYVANVTTLQGNGNAVVGYNSTATAATVLDGFTITGGTVNGGIDNSAGGSATFSNLIVTANSVNSLTSRGGGMTNAGRGIPTLTNVLFSNNSALNGGGMQQSPNGFGGGLILLNVTFLNNTAQAGGGLYNTSGGSTDRVIMDSVLFDGNTATIGNGGAIYSNANNGNRIIGTQVVFVNNRINSTFSASGGGVHMESASIRLTDAVFYNNSVSSPGALGGALTCNGNTRDSLINITFVNNTVAGTGTPRGGAIYNNANAGAPASGNMYVANCVFYNNTVSAVSSDIAYAGTGNAIALINNYLQNALPVGRTNYSAAGNIPSMATTDPFTASSPIASAKGPDGNWMTSDDGLHLQTGSTAIDAGSNTVATTYGVTTDITGIARVLNSTVDMGAYEGPSAAVLPVTLISFAGSLQNGIAQLLWQTGIEDNFSHFEIEKSNDAQTYTVVGSAVAKGNNSSYKANLPQTKPRAYYRLKMVDRDGHTTLSQVVTLSQFANAASLKLYPNPAINHITVEGDKTAIATVILYNAMGQVMGAARITRTNDTQAMVNLQGLPPGIYTVKTTTASHTFQKQ